MAVLADTRQTGAERATESLLWHRLRHEGDEAAREQLLVIHVPYARVVAATYYARRTHDEIEFGDYLQLASVGLLEAMDRFDPGFGVTFRTFAARRMHGSILDGLERLTEKQRQIAARQRLKAERAESVRSRARAASADAGSEEERMLQYVAEAGLGFALAWLLEGTGMIERAERSEAAPFYRALEIQQLRERIRELVEALPTQERTVIFAHYVQQQSFGEICASLRLSKGRISQIHRHALDRLRENLRSSGEMDVLC